VQAQGATQCTLLISDVPEDVLHIVGSDPSLPDPSTTEDCARSLVPISTCWIFPTTSLRSSATKNLKRRRKPAILLSGTVVGSLRCPVTIFAELQESRPRDWGFMLLSITAATIGSCVNSIQESAFSAPVNSLCTYPANPALADGISSSLWSVRG
jgi:hypothetical protein